MFDKLTNRLSHFAGNLLAEHILVESVDDDVQFALEFQLSQLATRPDKPIEPDDISQLAAHLSEDVYNRLRDRSVKVALERAKKGEAIKAPQLRVGSMKKQEPRDGVIESVVLVQSPTRTRAVTIRLEGINRRWRATSVSVI